MLIRRHLYHCSRCLYTQSPNGLSFPGSLTPEPIIPVNASITRPTTRISLSPDSVPKVPPRNWNQLANGDSKGFAATVESELKNAKNKIFGNPGQARNGLMQSGPTHLPPVASNDASKCVVWIIPHSFLASDVKRLIPFDPSKQTEHPLTDAIRVYKNNLLPTTVYLLRFQKPEYLKQFLENSPNMEVFGKRIEPRIFAADMDPSCVRPRSLLNESKTPTNLLRHRYEYFRKFKKNDTIVVVEGFPRNVSLSNITYFATQTLKGEKFEWAYEWANRPGEGTEFERNAICVGTGPRGIAATSMMRRWAFTLKDPENAWRFARRLHNTYYRLEREKKDYLIKAFVMD